MRMSESLRRGTIDAVTGVILNRFKIKSRRNMLFFEDILANYVKTCEQNGKGVEIKKINQKWAILCISQLIPPVLIRILPVSILAQRIKGVWINLGLVEDFKVEKNEDIITIVTKNEFVTRIVKNNVYMSGAYEGIINEVFGLGAICIEISQDKNISKYVFKLSGSPPVVRGKYKKTYDALNSFKFFGGFGLKDALKSGIFQLRSDNRIYFRGKSIIPIENTVFHIFSNQGIFLEEVPKISFDYFSKLIEMGSSNEQKLSLLKKLLQAMGWGSIKMSLNGHKNIAMEIANPPYGLQTEPDNWRFLSMVILGYFWLLDNRFGIDNIYEKRNTLFISYGC